MKASCVIVQKVHMPLYTMGRNGEFDNMFMNGTIHMHFLAVREMMILDLLTFKVYGVPTLSAVTLTQTEECFY